MNVTETAEFIGIKKDTPCCWVSRKKIACVKMGRRTMFDVRDIEEFIATG